MHVPKHSSAVVAYHVTSTEPLDVEKFFAEVAETEKELERRDKIQELQQELDEYQSRVDNLEERIKDLMTQRIKQ